MKSDIDLALAHALHHHLFLWRKVPSLKLPSSPSKPVSTAQEVGSDPCPQEFKVGKINIFASYLPKVIDQSAKLAIATRIQYL